MKVTTASFTLSLRLPVFLLEFLVGHRQPVGQHGAQLVDDQLVAHRLSNVGRRQRRPLRAQQLLIALLADERAVFLERRRREDALSHFFVARA